MSDLNHVQTQAAIKLYQEGTTNYRDISEKLGVNYSAVNKVMTKYKRESGILKRDSVNDDLLKELQFLREFYISQITKH